jgi:acetolactate synthase-1/3 small subunit
MSENQQGLQGPPPEERPHPDGRRNSQGIRIDPEVEAEPESRTAMISALVEHEPGVLARIAGLFSRRQFNIESLTVGPTTVEGNARLTLIVEEPEPGIDQAKKQLAKLKPVISVGELENRPIRSELVLLKVNGDEPDKVQAVTEMYDGETLDAGPETITVQLTGEYDEIEDALDAYRQFGIIEIARTGPTALARGSTPTTPGEKPAAEATAVGVETDGGTESDAAGDGDSGDASESQAETTN